MIIGLILCFYYCYCYLYLYLCNIHQIYINGWMLYILSRYTWYFGVYFTFLGSSLKTISHSSTIVFFFVVLSVVYYFGTIGFLALVKCVFLRVFFSDLFPPLILLAWLLSVMLWNIAIVDCNVHTSISVWYYYLYVMFVCVPVTIKIYECKSCFAIANKII